MLCLIGDIQQNIRMALIFVPAPAREVLIRQRSDVGLDDLAPRDEVASDKLWKLLSDLAVGQLARDPQCKKLNGFGAAQRREGISELRRAVDLHRIGRHPPTLLPHQLHPAWSVHLLCSRLKAAGSVAIMAREGRKSERLIVRRSTKSKL